MSNDLALPEIHDVVALFSDRSALDEIISGIETKARAQLRDSDISTKEGRSRIASIAFSVGKQKQAIENLGKAAIAEVKERVKRFDAERRYSFDRLQAIQDDIRRPLTEFEEKEKSRIESHEAAIAELHNIGNIAMSSGSIGELSSMKSVVERHAIRSWDEFETRGTNMLATAAARIEERIAALQKQEAERAELERLRIEAAERDRREREERIAREAAERAKREAEAKAEADRKALEEKARKEREAAERERERIEREKAEAEERARLAEERANREKAEAEARAKKAATDAAARAKAEQEAAVRRERERQEAEKKAEAEAVAKREADNKLRAKVHAEAVAALKENVSPVSGYAVDIVGAIAAGRIPHVKIIY